MQRQNPLSGFAARRLNRRIAALAVFLCDEHAHIKIMVGCAGEPKGSPGFLLTGTANSVHLTTPSFAAKGGDF
uniref:ash family protein n=1 Tax=Hafnia alvei TaxID=569 RepID=UPI003F5901EF